MTRAGRVISLIRRVGDSCESGRRLCHFGGLGRFRGMLDDGEMWAGWMTGGGVLVVEVCSVVGVRDGVELVAGQCVPGSLDGQAMLFTAAGTGRSERGEGAAVGCEFEPVPQG